MHILTKIFVVLVSLLAVLLVPLVVVYAYNEDNYKARYEAAQAQQAASAAALAEAEARHGAEVSQLQTQIEQYRGQVAGVTKDKVAAETKVRMLESDLATQQTAQADIDAKLATLASAMEVSQNLTEGLVDEVRGLRSEVLALERQKIELDEALRDVNGQLEVAVQARRALQEELERVKDELARANDAVGRAIAQFGFDPNAEAGDIRLVAVAPTINLDATVIGVRRSADQTLAEIDAGSVDGIKENWEFSIARGGSFIGKLRIIEVDVNRSTGVVLMENAGQGRLVEVGDLVYSRVGRD